MNIYCPDIKSYNDTSNTSTGVILDKILIFNMYKCF